MNFLAHPCSLLAICPGESREAIGALQDKLKKKKKRTEKEGNTLESWRV